MCPARAEGGGRCQARDQALGEKTPGDRRHPSRFELAPGPRSGARRWNVTVKRPRRVSSSAGTKYRPAPSELGARGILASDRADLREDPGPAPSATLRLRIGTSRVAS